MRLLFLLLAAGYAFGQETPGLSEKIDREVEQAIRDKMFPGAVVIVGQKDRILHRKAYGSRAIEPAREAMTLDTIFDIASLTKVTATLPSIAKLYEQGKLRPEDPVTKYLPEFQGGKSPITVRQLMTHFSGLRPDLDLEPEWSGYQTGIGKALIDKPADPPGKKFVYSDINFELLGEMVRRLSGKPLDQFAQEEIFRPLGMTETTFNPPAALRGRIAPTTYDKEKMLRGVVHDPTSRFMGGVAGHAGLFSTADDLTKYARMWINQGGKVLTPATVRKFTENAAPTGQPVMRSLGWDIDSPYSSNRGEVYPVGSFGHTGFTGTTLWIDPSTHSYVILLSNRLHPRQAPNINAVRGRIATLAASFVGAVANHQTETGLDVLEAEKFAPLAGKKVGLITNHTGLDRAGRRNIDVMRAAGVNLAKLFAPEHGITGKEDRNDVGDAIDGPTGLVIYSLYDNGRTRLTPAMLEGLDALVFDIQDAGARFYTYSCTLLYAVEEAGKAKKAFYVLDRPNPITGTHVEGPMLDDSLRSFVGCYDMPVRHGMTFGELATMANAERRWGANLQVVQMKNWRRSDWFDSTGLTWIDPSPNMRSLNAATLYPGIALIEASRNLSVGRGTDAPFEQIGADWINGLDLARALNARNLPGVRFYPTKFTPTDSNFKGKTIEGVRFVITDRGALQSVAMGLEIARTLRDLYPGKIDFEVSKALIGNRRTIDALKSGGEVPVPDLSAFEARRAMYLLYP
jgi:uncharacterized protein YbbC (DUF1343 family)/CubicO group peptidase (beta-lactamase class C family)